MFISNIRQTDPSAADNNTNTPNLNKPPASSSETGSGLVKNMSSSLEARAGMALLNSSYLALKINNNLAEKAAEPKGGETKKEEAKNAEAANVKPAGNGPLYTEWQEKGRLIPNQNKYNDLIEKAVNDPQNPYPEISAKQLKSLILRESHFKPEISNSTDHVGLGQFDVDTAKAAGLHFDGTKDPRKDPAQAIPAILITLKAKEKAVINGTHKHPGLKAFDPNNNLSKEGTLNFTLAAYNYGETNILIALSKAYKNGVPLDGPKFNDILPFLPTETKNYLPQILNRAEK